MRPTIGVLLTEKIDDGMAEKRLDQRDDLIAGNAAFLRDLAFEREPRLHARAIGCDVDQRPAVAT